MRINDDRNKCGAVPDKDKKILPRMVTPAA